jgi:hypothetical protein
VGECRRKDLQRLHEDVLVFAENLQHHLRRAHDAVRGLDRMPIFQQAEIGQRLQLIHVGTDDLVEVRQHPVAEPVRRQIRQTIEHVIGRCPHPLDHVQDPVTNVSNPPPGSIA